MSYLYAKYSGSVITNATNFNYDGSVNGKDSFSFTLPNYYSENFDTWKARYDEDVILYTSSDDSIIMIGQVQRVLDTNPLQVSIIGVVDKLTWYPLTEEVCDLKLDELYVTNNPDTYAGEFEGSGTWTNNGANTDVEFNGHLSDYELDDNADSIQRLNMNVDSGAIEFWFALEHADCDFDFLFEDNANNRMWRIYSDSQMCKVITGAGTTNYENLAADQWYHVKCSFIYHAVTHPNGDISVVITKDESATDVVTNEIYEAGAGGVNLDDVELHSADATYDLYIDGPAYNGDEGYDTGDNLVGKYYNLYLEDAEGNDPDLSADEYNSTDNRKIYGLISDTTMEEEGPVEINPTANSAIVQGTDDVGGWGDCAAVDKTYWYSYWIEGTHGTANTLEVKLAFDIQTENISDTSDITKIDITLEGKFTSLKEASSPVNPQVIDIYWSQDSTLNTSTDILLASYNCYPQILLAKTYAFSWYEDHPLTIHLTEDDNDNETYFRKANNEWNDGYIFLHLRDNPWFEGHTVDATGIYIDFCQIDVYYSTESFDPINLEVYDTIATDHIQLYNSAVDDREDLDDKGIAAGDTVMIGVSAEEAFHRCFQGTDIPEIALNLRDGTAFSKGIAEEYGPQKAYQLFTKLIDKFDCYFWVEYLEDVPVITVMKLSDISAAAVTYQSGTDMPSRYNVDSSNNEFGSVQIAYNGGMTRKIQAATPSTNKKIYYEDRKDILTLAVAEAYALQLAEKYSSLTYNIHAEWDYLPTNVPQIGVKYNFTMPKWNGSAFTTTAYTEQICRAVHIEQDGTTGGGWTITADFGIHHTENDEFIGRAIAANESEILRMKALNYTAANSVVTRHGQLDGIGENDHHTPTVKYTDAEAVTAMGVKGDGNPLNHDIYSDADARLAVATMDANIDMNDNDLVGLNDLNAETGHDLKLKCDAGNDILFWEGAGERFRLDGGTNALLMATGCGLGFDDNNTILEFSKDGTMAGNTDNAVPTEKAVVTYVAAEIADAIDDGMVTTCMYRSGNGGNGTSNNGQYQIDQNEYAFGHFFLDNESVNLSTDCEITVMCYTGDADAAYSVKISIATTKTDTTEAFAWNVENATVEEFDMDPASRVGKWQYTLDTTDFDADDDLYLKFLNNEAGKSLYIYGIFIKYKQKV